MFAVIDFDNRIPAGTAANFNSSQYTTFAYTSRIGALPSFVSCRPLPDDPQKSLVVLAFPETADEDSAELNLDMLWVDNANEAIVKRLRQDRALFSDAWRLSTVKIDTARYHIAPGVRAFGVRVTHSGSSPSNPAESEALTLYVAEGETFKPVLAGLLMKRFFGEWDAMCAGNFSETERTLSVARVTTRGYFNLIVTSKTSRRDRQMIKGECVDATPTQSTERHTLVFDGSKYVVPEELKGN